MTVYHVGISGGKDSGALLLWMIHESGIPADQIIATFCDTGNEVEDTYNQIRILSDRVHPVEWLKPELDFYELARKKNRFPSPKARFCTQELKMKPTKEFIDGLLRQGFDVVGVSGVRADESHSRSKLAEWGEPMESYFGIKEWRPILKWSIVEVVAIHKKYGIPMNRLYANGAQRVGCFPCIMSRKSEIRNIAKNYPERIDFIREQEWTDEKRAMIHTFFPRKKVPEEFRSHAVRTKDGREVKVATIDDIVAWSKTKDGKHSHGQMVLDFWHEDEICSTAIGFCE